MGAQYALGKGFSVFGEVGLLYGRATGTSRTTNTTSDTNSNTFGTRTGVGVAFYF